MTPAATPAPPGIDLTRTALGIEFGSTRIKAVLTDPSGAALLDPTGTLEPGIPLCPPEGDAGTGMVATNSVRPRTGSVSAGTSAFAMIVLERPLRTRVEQVDLVATPSGAPVAMVHSNNCTSDLNAWVEVFGQFAAAIGAPVERGRLFEVLLGAAADAGAPGPAGSPGGVLAFNFLSGEHLVGLAEGRPLVLRRPEATLSLATLMRAHLFAAFASMAHGLRVLRAGAEVPIDSMFAHGGVFATPEIPQRVLAAAFGTPVSVGATASQGGAWGMALLAGYRAWAAGPDGPALEDYLADDVFCDAEVTTVAPAPAEVEEYSRYLETFTRALPIQAAAAELF